MDLFLLIEGKTWNRNRYSYAAIQYTYIERRARRNKKKEEGGLLVE